MNFIYQSALPYFGLPVNKKEWGKAPTAIVKSCEAEWRKKEGTTREL